MNERQVSRGPRAALTADEDITKAAIKRTSFRAGRPSRRRRRRRRIVRPTGT